MARKLYLPQYEAGLGAGDPLLHLPGSGAAQPRGLEAMFFYNDLGMNIMRNIDRYKIDEVDGFGDPEVRDAREPLPADHGEQALKAFYGGRPISITGRIQVGNIAKLRDMQQALRSAFRRLVEAPLIITIGDDETAVFVNCRKVAATGMKESQPDRLYKRDFLIQLRASNPRIFSARMYTASNVLSGGSNSAVFEPLNAGNFEARPVIRLHGPMRDIVITCEDTGRRAWIDGGVPEHEIFTLDIHRRSFKDAAGGNRFKQLRSSSRRVELPPGNSTITVTAAAGSGSRVDLSHRNTWI